MSIAMAVPGRAAIKLHSTPHSPKKNHPTWLLGEKEPSIDKLHDGLKLCDRNAT